MRRVCEKFAEEKFVSLTVSDMGMCGDGDSGGGHMMMNVSAECEPCSLRVCMCGLCGRPCTNAHN